MFRATHFNLAKEYIVKREKNSTGTGGSNPVSFLSNSLVASYDYVNYLCQKKEKCVTKSSVYA